MLAIYTPTFNRSFELKRLYESLCSQKNKNFFWLVVDDGSTDGTEKNVKLWMNEKKVNIKYIKKENGGKHTAVNLALDMVDNFWNLCVDSDDYLLNENVIDKIYKDINFISEDKNIVSIVYPFQFENIPLKKINEISRYTKCYDLRNNKMNVHEVSIVSRPNAYNNIRFPVFGSENFISEGAIEIPKIFNGARVYFHRPIVGGKYLDNGLSKNIINIWKKNPKGYYYVRNLQNKYYIKKKMFIKVFRPSGQMVAYNIYKGEKYLNGIEHKFLGFISIPLGYFYWIKKFR